jgi:hypothetical protein
MKSSIDFSNLLALTAINKSQKIRRHLERIKLVDVLLDIETIRRLVAVAELEMVRGDMLV